nr:Mur ligase family protein [Tessaracoccus coleopterorum]
MHHTGADAPHILAADSVDALSWLARGVVAEARVRGMLSIGVTGSSGKTSTKDLMAQVFEAAGATVAPVGSQNNEIGVPLTACRVGDDTAYLISEMGARGIGHISWLTSLVGLDIGVCLNIGRAHVGEFGGMETTAKAKSEIVADLAPTGWAVLNADDALVAGMAAATRARIAWFGEGSRRVGSCGSRRATSPWTSSATLLHAGRLRCRRGAFRARVARGARPPPGVQRAGGRGRRARRRDRAGRGRLRAVLGDVAFPLADGTRPARRRCARPQRRLQRQPDSMAAGLRTASEIVASAGRGTRRRG